ncbi:MAG: (Fe-S)-binding protein [bacterium]
MLSPVEKIVFLVLAAVSVLIATRGFVRIVRVVRGGRPAERSDRLVARFVGALIDVGLQRPIFRIRPVVSIFHALIFFGFSFYLLVNINEIVEAFVEGWSTIGGGAVASGFNLIADVLSVLAVIGMAFFLVRRFIAKPKVFEFNPNVMIHPSVSAGGINIDSLLVGLFILFHVGGRWMGTVFHLAGQGSGDTWLPTASLLAPLFYGMTTQSLELARHLSWWTTLGLVLVYTPYIPFSKAVHMIIAPVNLALGRNTPRGLMDAPTDGAAPGAASLADLPWPQVLDAYACIMCMRCQEVCPAHHTGTPLSPAALEINKRYYIKSNGSALANGNARHGLLEYAISEDAVWACTTCYACVRVCPVGNEPMMDIVDLRRRLVFDANMPDELADVLRNLDEQGNSFGESNRRRSRWSKELDFEIKDAASEPVKYLWYVGDFASFNPNCQEVSRRVAQVLNAAGVDFGILQRGENSTGNDVRRVGEEGLFESLAEKNIEALARCDFQEIFTTDPHTFNALKNEYPKLGGNYQVRHYSTLLLELIKSGNIQLRKKIAARATYHDPCYLGRYNGIYDAPRELMELCGVELVEMPRNKENSFCCGAGGGRIWMKDHDDMTQRPSENRIEEAIALPGVRYFTVACPKDMSMYADAVKTSGNEGKIEVRDIIDYVIEAMELPQSGAAEQVA